MTTRVCWAVGWGMVVLGAVACGGTVETSGNGQQADNGGASAGGAYFGSPAASDSGPPLENLGGGPITPPPVGRGGAPGSGGAPGGAPSHASTPEDAGSGLPPHDAQPYVPPACHPVIPATLTFSCAPLAPGSAGCPPPGSFGNDPPPTSTDTGERYPEGCSITYPFVHPYYPCDLAMCLCQDFGGVLRWICPM